MIATFFSAAIVCLLVSGLGSLVAGKRSTIATAIGVSGAVTGGALGAVASVMELVHPQIVLFYSSWNMPFGSLYVRIDTLSAIFLFPLFLLSAASALFGSEYLRPHSPEKSIGLHWCFFNLLSASMAMVVTSSSALLFLLSWETMSITSFFLVMFDHEKPQVKYAGWMYLAATHIGMVFLLVFFLIAQQHTGSFDFDGMARHGFPKSLAGLLLVFALIGFGSKAGFVPFHVWLPEAHPAAPSHVSALMSGIMIKMGIYGICRTLVIIGPPQAWWGVLLVAIGALSGVFGVLFALGQHDLKRLLAYHSVENIGIIALGLGCGLLGVNSGNMTLAAFGFTGALLHVVNHALFKGLLFLSAGAVLSRTGTLALERLGGLIKRMPLTGLLFLVGAIAICGIPPLNGFISEFMIYIGAFNGLISPQGPLVLAGVAALLSLSLIGGLALACFTKAFGTVFLGEPRSRLPEAIKPGLPMLTGMMALAVFCFVIGAGFFFLLPFLIAPVALLCGTSPLETTVALGGLKSSMAMIGIGAGALTILVVAIAALRVRLFKKRNVANAVTWDCGYAKPSARMQYTASSFAQPLMDFFGRILGPEKHFHAPASYFPKEWSFQAHIRDLFLDRLFVPFFRRVEWSLDKMRWVQGGKLHFYVLYIALTLVFLLVWKFVWDH